MKQILDTLFIGDLSFYFVGLYVKNLLCAFDGRNYFPSFSDAVLQSLPVSFVNPYAFFRQNCEPLRRNI